MRNKKEYASLVLVVRKISSIDIWQSRER